MDNSMTQITSTVPSCSLIHPPEECWLQSQFASEMDKEEGGGGGGGNYGLND